MESFPASAAKANRHFLAFPRVHLCPAASCLSVCPWGVPGTRAGVALGAAALHLQPELQQETWGAWLVINEH